MNKRERELALFIEGMLKHKYLSPEGEYFEYTHMDTEYRGVYFRMTGLNEVAHIKITIVDSQYILFFKLATHRDYLHDLNEQSFEKSINVNNDVYGSFYDKDGYLYLVLATRYSTFSDIMNVLEIIIPSVLDIVRNVYSNLSHII